MNYVSVNGDNNIFLSSKVVGFRRALVPCTMLAAPSATSTSSTNFI